MKKKKRHTFSYPLGDWGSEVGSPVLVCVLFDCLPLCLHSRLFYLEQGARRQVPTAFFVLATNKNALAAGQRSNKFLSQT